MSPRLYIDCDDTLVLWHDATDDERGYDLNAPLIADIHCFLDHEGHNKHGIEADLDALDLLLEIQREKDDATTDRE